MCDRTNGTYLNCPIANFSLDEGSTINFAMHNPSSIELKMAQISVPHPNFKVQQLSGAESTDVESDVICVDDRKED
jgi:hypothetical protein